MSDRLLEVRVNANIIGFSRNCVQKLPNLWNQENPKQTVLQTPSCYYRAPDQFASTDKVWTSKFDVHKNKSLAIDVDIKILYGNQNFMWTSKGYGHQNFIRGRHPWPGMWTSKIHHWPPFLSFPSQLHCRALIFFLKIVSPEPFSQG